MINADLTLNGNIATIQNVTPLPAAGFQYNVEIQKVTPLEPMIVAQNVTFPYSFGITRGSYNVELIRKPIYVGAISAITNLTTPSSSNTIYRIDMLPAEYQAFLATFVQGSYPNNKVKFINPNGSLATGLDTHVFGYSATGPILGFAQVIVFFDTLLASPPPSLPLFLYGNTVIIPLSESTTFNPTLVDGTIYPRYAPVINISPANSPRFVVKEMNGCCEMKNPNNTLFSEFFDRDSACFYGYKQKYNECDEIMIMFKSNYWYHKLQIWKNNQLLDTIGCAERTLQAPVQPLAQGVKFFETKIHWKGFGCGCYQLKIIGKDRETAIGELFPTIPDSFVAISEPIQVGHFEKDFVLIEYTNNTNNYHLLYSENPAFEKLKHILRVEGWFGFEAEIEIDNEVYRTAAGKVEKLYESLAKKLNFRTGRLPNYMHEKLIIALSHDEVIINGVNVTADGKYNTKTEKNKLQLRTAEIQLTDNSFFFENEP